jgi:outer membrane cobalamin receptor
MKKRILIASVSFVLLLGVNGTVWGTGEPALPPNPVGAQNSPTGKEELLMFVDEQELVTATKRPISIRKAPATATIITADDIRDMGARTLVDVLKMVPGFGISINQFGTLLVEVRGIRTSTSEKILVMIDGHSLNKNTNGSALLYNFANNLPIENIRQVEVVKGPG